MSSDRVILYSNQRHQRLVKTKPDVAGKFIHLYLKTWLKISIATAVSKSAIADLGHLAGIGRHSDG